MIKKPSKFSFEKSLPKGRLFSCLLTYFENLGIMEMHRSSRYERGEAMASALWGKFASEVLKEVKFKYDHAAIRQELVEHMEELYEDLRAEGMDAPVAEVMAVEYMGNTTEIGKALNEEHSPLLGWIWRISRWAVWAVFLCSVLWWAGPFFKATAINVFGGYAERKDYAVVYSVDVNETVKTYGEKIHFDKILYYEDGILEICASTLNWDRRTSASALTNVYRLAAMDETGKRYYDMRIAPEDEISYLRNRRGIYFKCQLYIYDFPEDAEKLYIGYGWQKEDYIQIDLLRGGEG